MEPLRRLKKANYQVAKMAFALPRGGNLLRNLKTRTCGRSVCDDGTTNYQPSEFWPERIRASSMGLGASWGLTGGAREEGWWMEWWLQRN